MKTSNSGFVDLQVNGWFGIDFSDINLSEESFSEACQLIFASGTVAFLPTIVTSDMRVYEHNLPIIARACKSPEFSGRVLGVHIEGPFISPKDGARGAHPLQYVIAPDIAVLDKLIELSDGNIRLLTVAAECIGVVDLIKHARRRGITVSLGHQLAGSRDIEHAVKAGASSLTHLGNGLPAMINRHDNPLFDGLVCDELVAMIISDGHHIPSALIKIILSVKGIGHVVVTSDATALTGMPAGQYKMFGNDIVRDESGKVYNPETGYLAGSGSTMFECMNYLSSLKLIGRDQLVQVGFTNPLKLINVSLNADFAPPEYDAVGHVFVL
jgi:N-acetylglucosamine-6-phosphate deacetylase